ALPGYGEVPNGPLKAGDVTLKKASNYSKNSLSAKKLQRKPAPPILPVGNVAAPQIPAAAPPVLSSSKSSSASVMMMQGLRSILQKSGQNPDLPKSNMIPEEDGAPVVLTPTSKAASFVDGTKYQPGQEPRSLAQIVSGETPFVKVPKATELEQAPALLEKSDDAASKPTEQAAASVFGAPAADDDDDDDDDEEDVKDNSKTEAPSAPVVAAVPPTPVPEVKAPEVKTPVLATPPCVPSVTSWTKTCEDAGYPSGYVGSLVGESRVLCPGGEVQDVWLNNTCALPNIAKIASAPEKSSKAAPSIKDSGSVMAANCGSANGMMSEKKPEVDLCDAGTSTEVTGEGPWYWSCNGAGSSMSVSCAAPVSKIAQVAAGGAAMGSSKNSSVSEEGKCGSSDGVVSNGSPKTGLCSKGIASQVSGSGPWVWACSGINGGEAVSCKALSKVDGACGSANGAAADSMPRQGLCLAGYASAVNGDGPWSWTCSGIYGGVAASCSASPKTNAVCGQASTSGHSEAPKESLCSSGEPGTVNGSGPWYWTCGGLNGGASVTCNAPVSSDGVCGSSNGKAVDKSPSEGLCSSGVASSIKGSGPWSWSCAGSDGGNSVSCTASVAEGKLSAAVAAAPAVGSAPAPAAAPVAAVKTEVPAAKATTEAASVEEAIANAAAASEASEAPVSAPASALAANPIVASCGASADVFSAKAPKSDLCSSGSPSPVTGGKGKGWKWDCLGSSGGAVSCKTPATAAKQLALKQVKESAVADARCGSASGQNLPYAPVTDLCDFGTPGKVQGNGPWNWSCETKSGSKSLCSALIKVDGNCGEINGSVLSSAPVAKLCSSGEATAVGGNGPWMWSCVGVGGGRSVSCSASAQTTSRVDGVCGSSANAVLSEIPTVNLCDSGIPSSVHGSGPWNWTCSGMNGGTASICSNTKIVEPPGPMIDANCGSSNGVATLSPPTGGLCSSGTETVVKGDGPWNWNCLGANGGMTVSCTAPLMPPDPIDGVCGAANGVPTLNMPKSSLCSSGIISAVSGKGPWTWSCSGVNGGSAVSCVAPTGGKGKGPLPSMTSTLPAAPAASPLPKKGALKVPEPRSSASELVTPNLQPGELPAQTVSQLPAGSGQLAPPPVRDEVVKNQVSGTPSTGQLGASSKFVLDGGISTIDFDKGSDQLSADAIKLVDQLAISLLSHGGARITLISGADAESNTPRDARRLSLNRALVLRDYLASKGVPSSRVDIRALGANITGSNANRVDIKVN
ncbi:MAG: OmpA family protein, partial [Alphaproteobacteria bacterium]|nr:OmpA family protein [Alphaproteobacteria bacterium]